MGKLKIDIKTVAVMVAINVLANIVVGGFLGSALIVESSVLSDFKYFSAYTKGDVIYTVGDELGHLVGYIILNFTAYLLCKPRKKEFLAETKGLVTKKQGLMWHLERYKYTEIAILCVQSVIFLVMQFLCKEHSAFSMFYRVLGIPFGFIASVLIMGALQISHIVASQYYWRIRHYMGI